MENYNHDELACKLQFTNGRASVSIPLCGEITKLGPAQAAMVFDSTLSNPVIEFDEAEKSGALDNMSEEEYWFYRQCVEQQNTILFQGEQKASLFEVAIRLSLALSAGTCEVVFPDSSFACCEEDACDCADCDVCDGSCIKDVDENLTVPEYIDFLKESEIGREWL